MDFCIGKRAIGSEHPPVVIAEIGINHNGSLAVAKEMVDAAYRAGAEIVKHQTHIVDDEMSPAAKTIIPGNANISIYDIMSSSLLDEGDEYQLMQYTLSRGMIFLSTPFSRAAADRLEGFGVPAYKIGSGELNNYPLVEHIASFGKPMILSTGMNDIAAVQKAVNIVRAKGVPFALLHTTNLYPTPAPFVRLGAMTELHTAFPEAPFGLSDHTVNNNACLAAVALGASILERHFTDTMQRSGPDIVCSMDERNCAELIVSSREIFSMCGGKKCALPEERITSDFAFATVVTIAPVKAGECFTKDNIWVKRPGTGAIPAEQYPDILGRRAICDIAANTHLAPDMIGV